MKILYFSPILWNDLKQRPQHLAEELSKDHKIYYVEPSVSYLSCLVNKTSTFKEYYFKVNDNLSVIRLNGKFRLPKSIEIIDFLGLNNIYEKGKMRELFKICDIIWLGSPIYYSLVKHLGNKKIIYDKMDDYVELTKNKFLKKIITRSENELVKRANLIFTTCKSFYEKIHPNNENIFIVNNGVNLNFTHTNNLQNNIVRDILKLKSTGNIVFGYVGTIDHWFDFDVIKNIIEFNDKFHVVLVGKNNIKNKQTNLKQIVYYNSISKKELGSVIESFDYCLYPFKKNNFLDTIDPVKIYEYLSLNKKVIAVKSKETCKFEKYVSLYNDSTELKEILGQADLIKKPFYDEAQREIFINNNSWEERGKLINNIMKKCQINCY